MLTDPELAKACATALGDLTLQVGPRSIEDCRKVAEKMIGTALASIAVNTDFSTAMQALGAVVREVSEQLGVTAQVDVLEVPLCSTRSH